MNGKAFLAHVQHLSSVGVAAYCQICYRRGARDDVTVGKNDEEYIVRCEHRQERIPASSVHGTDELLNRLGWSLRCDKDCAKLGMFDGVQASNDPQSPTVSIRCGCTIREYQMPVAGLA